MLAIRGLKVSIEGPASTKVTAGKKEILKGIDLEVGSGEIHVLMGPNGSGKSTLAQVLMGSPGYKVVSSRFTVHGKDISKLTPDKRAKLGIFLAFQHPVEIPGVSVFNVLRRAKQSNGKSAIPLYNSVARKKKIYSPLATIDVGGARILRQELVGYLRDLKLSEDFLSRSLNEGFSGGEKKRSEILQMMALSPKLVILDEIDSGLDVDGLKTVTSAINQFTTKNPRSSILIITHYARILRYLKPDFVHIMMDGIIVKSGSMKLARQIEERGYEVLNDERLKTNANVIASEARFASEARRAKQSKSMSFSRMRESDSESSSE